MALDAENKQFLAQHGWAKDYKAIIQNEIAALRAAGKPVPSLDLVLAVITQESGGQAWAVRFEPKFKTWLEGQLAKDPSKFKKFTPSISRDTEIMLRATSFGPMQLLGQTLRELGCTVGFLTEVCKPELGIAYGIRFLSKLMTRHSAENDVIASYNAGSPRKNVLGKYSNQEYVDSVNALRVKWKYIIEKGWL